MKQVLYAISYIVIYFVIVLALASFLDIWGLLDGLAFEVTVVCTIGYCICKPIVLLKIWFVKVLPEFLAESLASVNDSVRVSEEDKKLNLKVTFDNDYGEMELASEIRSIFDQNIAGQIGTDGEYYVIHFDHKTHELYALTNESEDAARALGHTLDEGEEAVFNGEKVRAMTYSEECAYNEDRLEECVDIWGNIACDN